MVKLDIISGFLGAGKTTLIKKLLSEKLSNEKLVIIENEFGQIGIDGGILRNSNIEVKEINSGCICCTLMGDFVKSIEEVIEKYNPERIIIEPSGVGKLSDVINACKSTKLIGDIKLNMLITVVDVLKHQIYMNNFGEFFENQIKHAKTIILSRTQKVDNTELQIVANSIKKSNATANIITTPWESIDAELITSVAEQENAELLNTELKELKKVVLKRSLHHKGCNCGCGNTHNNSHQHSADEVFDFWGIETPKSFNTDDLKAMLKLLNCNGQYGTILRGKGVVQTTNSKWVQFDYTPDEIEIREAKPDYNGKLCIIGKDLKKEELDKLFVISA